MSRVAGNPRYPIARLRAPIPPTWATRPATPLAYFPSHLGPIPDVPALIPIFGELGRCASRRGVYRA